MSFLLLLAPLMKLYKSYLLSFQLWNYSFIFTVFVINYIIIISVFLAPTFDVWLGQFKVYLG